MLDLVGNPEDRFFSQRGSYRYDLALIALHWLLVTLAVLGKMGMTGGFETLYVLSTELYPTVVRNVGMGTSSAFARAGSMLAPYIAQLVSSDIEFLIYF